MHAKCMLVVARVTYYNYKTQIKKLIRIQVQRSLLKHVSFNHYAKLASNWLLLNHSLVLLTAYIWRVTTRF